MNKAERTRFLAAMLMATGHAKDARAALEVAGRAIEDVEDESSRQTLERMRAVDRNAGAEASDEDWNDVPDGFAPPL